MKNTAPPSMAELIWRVRGEYLEMPGLQLTNDQACRLWGLSAPTCHTLLHTLVDTRFLTRTPDGRYRRAGP